LSLISAVTRSLGCSFPAPPAPEPLPAGGRKETEKKVAEAEKTGGQLSGFTTQFSEVIKDPAQLGYFLAETLPSQLPTILAAMVPGAGPAFAAEVKALQAAAQAATTVAAKQAAEKALGEAVKNATASAIKRGTAASVGTSAIQQGTDVGAGSYEEIYKYLIKQGATPELAAEQAINRARAAGASGAVISLLVQKLPGAQAMERALAGEKGKLGRIGGAALGIVKESPSEMLEEGGGKVAQNIAMQQVDPTRDALKGVGATMGSAALGAGFMGGTVGALSNRGTADEAGATTAPSPPPPAATTQTETEAGAKATEDAAVAQLVETKGYTESQARRIVKAKTAPTAEETTPAVEETKAGRGKKELPLPTKIPEWTDAALRSTLDFQTSKPEDQRNLPLVQAVQAEIEKRAATQGETQGATDAGQPITTPSGTSTEVAGAADQGPTATGVGGDQRSGVVPTQQDVVSPDGREVTEPAAVNEPTPVEEKQAPAEITEAPVEITTAPTEVLEEPVVEEPVVEEPVVKGKRGRKAEPPEVQVAKAEKRKVSRAEYQAAERKFSQNKEGALNQLEEANQPLDEGEFDNEEALAQAQEDRRAKKASAVNQLLDIEETHRGTALGKRAKAVLNDRTKISENELAKVKKGREVRKKTDLQGELKSSAPLASRTSVGKADAGFSKATNAAQALTQVIKTGNAFQRFLAKRLRPFVAGVKFVVVEQDDPTPERLSDLEGLKKT